MCVFIQIHSPTLTSFFVFRSSDLWELLVRKYRTDSKRLADQGLVVEVSSTDIAAYRNNWQASRLELSSSHSEGASSAGQSAQADLPVATKNDLTHPKRLSTQALMRIANKPHRVRHSLKDYEGVTDGVCRMADLFEESDDTEEIRVRLPDGTYTIASPRNLIVGPEISQGRAEYEKSDLDFADIVREINGGSISEEWLADDEMWRAICYARGMRIREVDEVAWAQLCAKRGYLLYRRNPRGF